MHVVADKTCVNIGHKVNGENYSELPSKHQSKYYSRHFNIYNRTNKKFLYLINSISVITR